MPSTIGIIASQIDYIPPVSVRYKANEIATLHFSSSTKRSINVWDNTLCLETWVYPTGANTTLFRLVSDTGTEALRVRYVQGNVTGVGALSGNIVADSHIWQATPTSTSSNTSQTSFSTQYTPLSTWIKVGVRFISTPVYSGNTLTTRGQRSLYVNDILASTKNWGIESGKTTVHLQIHGTGPACGYADFRYSMYSGTACQSPLFRTHVGTESTNSGSSSDFLRFQTTTTLERVYTPLPYSSPPPFIITNLEPDSEYDLSSSLYVEPTPTSTATLSVTPLPITFSQSLENQASVTRTMSLTFPSNYIIEPGKDYNITVKTTNNKQFIAGYMKINDMYVENVVQKSNDDNTLTFTSQSFSEPTPNLAFDLIFKEQNTSLDAYCILTPV